MKVEYRNRYGDLITFEQKGEVIVMTGGKYPRSGIWNKEACKPGYAFIDPSGGPMIYALAEWNGEDISGTNMGEFHKDWEGMTIDYITLEEDNTVLLHLNQWIKSIKTD